MNPKIAAGAVKPRLDLLEPVADEQISAALALGAAKYGVRNYLEDGVQARAYVAAMRRHLAAWLDGEDGDPESGLSHLAHVGANVHVLLACLAAGRLEDDRAPAPQPEPIPGWIKEAWDRKDLFGWAQYLGEGQDK